MPLSEREQRLLEQMELALSAEDPKFASHMVADPARARARRRVALGVVLLLLGAGTLVAGIVVRQVPIGALGFAVMVGAAAYTVSPAAPTGGALGTVQPDGGIRRINRRGRGRTARSSGTPRHGGFMQRMEQRWERRRNGGF
ncbi:MAG: DUF3040 domain-containing protein [Allobranchiibius sp.]